MAASPWAVASEIPGYITTTWGAQEGAPQDVQALAVDTTGWLWLGTSGGLYRFDGRSFSAHELLPPGYRGSRLVSSLIPDASGGLWVVYGRESARHLEADGNTITAPPGLPDAGIEWIVIDGTGRTFAAANGKLYVLTNGRWTMCDNRRWGLPGDRIRYAILDDEGSLVLASESGSYRLRRNATRVEQITAQPTGRFYPTPDGRVYYSSQGNLQLLSDVRSSEPARRFQAGKLAAFDVRGHFWTLLGKCPTVCVFTGYPKTVVSPDATPNATDFLALGQDIGATILLADAEGNTWVGTKSGLVRFQPSEVEAVPLSTATYYFAVMPQRDGTVVVASDSHAVDDVLYRQGATGLVALAPNLATTAIGEFPDGTVVLGGHRDIVRLSGADLSTFSRRPQGLGDEPLQVALPLDARRLWVSVRDHGLFLVDENHWRPISPGTPLAKGWPLVAAAAGQGRTWMGYANGALVDMSSDAQPRATEVLMSEVGAVGAILPGERLFVGGELGVGWFEGTVFHALKLRQANLLSGVTGLVRTADGALWASGRAGVVRVGAAELAAVMSGKADEAAFRIIEASAGLPGGAQQTRPLPTLHLDANGLLWVAATSGLAKINPLALRSHQGPHAAITGMSSPAGALPLSRESTLSADNRALDVAFTGVSLRDPDRVQLRYRLRGTDDGWHVGSVNGTVKYEALGPGDYQFEVQARGPEGDWSASVVSPKVRALPAFTETFLFVALLSIISAVAFYGAHRWRLHVVERRQLDRLRAQFEERDRIARELHDSMLQGMLGVALRVGAWKTNPRAPDDLKSSFGTVADQILGLVLEARARVITLRSLGAAGLPLSEAIRLIGQDHAEGSPADFLLEVVGDDRPLGDNLSQLVLDVVREAVHNAFVHASPHVVHVTLTYASESLTATIVDDGCGIPAQVLEEGRRPGHWGMITMQERAASAGAHLTMHSEPGRTVIELRVPLVSKSRRWRDSRRRRR